MTVLVPIGSTEQHGPHLPLSTDTTVAVAVAERVAVELGAVLAPALPYGASGEHQGFPGTVSIGTDALAVVIVELVRSISNWAGRIVIVNGHGGNVAALSYAVPLLRDQGHRVSWVPCAVTGDAHAGRTETSIMLHVASELVDLSRAEPGATAPLHELLSDLASRGVAAVSPNGILGDPTGAHAFEGGELLDHMVAGVLRRAAQDIVDERGCRADPVAAR
ncbi:MAG: mftE [Microbacteriaceae bacterium]|jgi:creatinine amidohydrolase|nr:mftE [Microbacteriaceae bacterium]